MALDSDGLQGAGQGAQAGAMFGPWGMAIGAGVGYVFGKKEGEKKAKELKKAMEEHAKLLRQETAKAQADIRRARTVSIINTTAALRHVERKSGQIKADISVQNAASDAIGASAMAVYSDADAQKDQAENEARRGMDYEMANLGVQLSNVLNQGFMSTRTAMDGFAKQATGKKEGADGLLNLAQAGGSMWAEGKFSSSKKSPVGDTVTSTPWARDKGYALGVGPGR